MLLNEDQVQTSVESGHPETPVSLAIRQAERMSEKGGPNYTVCRSLSRGICIYNDFQLKMHQDEIECIYSTDSGYYLNAGSAA